MLKVFGFMVKDMVFWVLGFSILCLGYEVLRLRVL